MLYHILLKPDVFWKKNYREIIETLSFNKIEFVSYDLIKVQNEIFDVLYMKDFKWNYDYWSHNKKFFSLGPCISLICVIPSDYTKFEDLKGSALPIFNKSDSIRGMFGVTDRVVNSIHWADSQMESIEEIKQIYKLTNVESTKIQSIKVKEFIKASRVCDFIDNMYMLYGEAGKVLCNILNRIKNRIATILIYLCSLFKIKVPLDSLYKDPFEYFSMIKKCYEFNPEVLIMVELYYEFVDNEITIKKYRLLDYFLEICKKNAIYVSKEEEFILVSNVLYYDVNLN